MKKKQTAANSQELSPEVWVDQHGDYLYRFALSRIKDPSVAEDLVQETFLAALGSRKNFKSRSAVRTWLTAILKHKIVDYLRKKNRERATNNVEAIIDSIDTQFDTAGRWNIKPGKWTVNPMKIHEQREFFDILSRCLAELPQRQAKAFMLREIEGLSTEEICKTLQVSATNSWVMLYRARMHLRRCLEINWLNTKAIESS
jgi:RNA polymerase sigma-70 factor (TIGR02943 family)